MSRHRLLLAAAFALIGLTAPTLADEPQWRHGAAFLGTVKYPPDFKRFDYVNPDAPKGGGYRQAIIGTFDSFNGYIIKGNPAAGLGLVTETLLAPSLDEAGSKYGLLAEAFRFPEDYGSASFRLRPEARWWDGTPVTPEDVVWSFKTQITLNPNLKGYYAHVKDVAATGEREVTFTFDETGNRELPLIVGEINVLPRHWWEGTDASGKKRDIREGTLEPPLGSGPYRIKSFETGRNVVYERVKDYWGLQTPTMVGTNNFDEVRFDYFRDPQVALEAFKGDTVDVRGENSAKNWATAYDFPARQDGRVLVEAFPTRGSGGMQAFVPNLRRDLFKDVRVRQALTLALDFEELNRTIFFNQYIRTESYFAPMELASSGLPSPAELALLEPLRDQVPAEVFTREYKAPVNGDPARVRENLRLAFDLLKAAGWENIGGRLINAKTKKPFTFEMLLDDSTFERVAVPYRESLKRLGIDMTIRVVDDTQYTNRTRDFDFDMISMVRGQSNSPGNEQLYFWGSRAADEAGSGNIAGIKNPAIDALIDKVVFAKDRDALVTATHALDRVLLWNHYVIPCWHYGKQRLAWWNRFSHPDTLPEYGGAAFPDIWWWDAEKAARTGGRR